MAKVVRRGREFFERLLEQREREGLTYPALSARSGVPVSTLQRWGRQLLAERRESPSRSPFVEVVASAPEEAEGRVEVLLCSGRTLTFTAGKPFRSRNSVQGRGARALQLRVQSLSASS